MTTLQQELQVDDAQAAPRYYYLKVPFGFLSSFLKNVLIRGTFYLVSPSSGDTNTESPQTALSVSPVIHHERGPSVGSTAAPDLRSSTAAISPQSNTMSDLEISWTIPRRADPAPVANRQTLMRFPAGDVKRIIGTRERLLGAVQKQIHMPITEDQVRLLLIKPGTGNEEINVSLIPLKDSDFGSERYPYEALSYHWGGGSEDYTVLIDKWTSIPIKKMSDAVNVALGVKKAEGNRGEGINARRFHVRKNLYDALKHLRQPTGLVPLWVDAVCIDQSNQFEKTIQVNKMGQIYQKAARVCVWLGLGDSESDRAMDFIQLVINKDRLPDLLSKEEHVPGWISLYRLLEWSWFTRRWIIQELALSRQATVHCGKKHVHWNDFRDAIGIFYRYFDTLKWKMRHYDIEGKPIGDLESLGAQLLVDLSNNVFRINDDGTYQSTKPLETLVSQLSQFDTTDPRDTIHALRNISLEGNLHKALHETNVQPAIPKSDYGQDLFEVYHRFVKWAIHASSSLDIICRHWALPERKEKGPATPYLISKLPTWIQTVDKSSYGRGAEVYQGRRAGDSFVGLPGKSNYTASGRTSPVVEFGNYETIRDCRRSYTSRLPAVVSQDMSLSVTGLLIGRVSSEPIEIPDGVITERCLETLGWTEDAAPAKLWRTLVADRGPKGDFAPTYYHRACLHCLSDLTVNRHLNAKELLSKATRKPVPNIAKDYLERVLAVTWNRCVLQAVSLPEKTTKKGELEKLVGLCAPKTRLGDEIVILYGCSVPVILRPVDDTSYEFMGEAFIYGKMDGEAMDEQHEEKIFRLI